MNLGADQTKTFADGRSRLRTTVADIARRTADVLDEHPVREGPYPIADVRERLSAHLVELRALVDGHPYPLAVDANGRPDRFGSELAGLMGYLQHILVLYHELDDLPARMRAQANRDLAAAHLWARKVRTPSRP